MRYIKVSSDNVHWLTMIIYASLVAAEFEDGSSGIIQPFMTQVPTLNIKVGKGLAFYWDAKLVLSGQTTTLGEDVEMLFEQVGFQPEYITEEEFYNLNA